MRRIISIVAGIIFLSHVAVRAQNVTFEASAKTVVAVGETFAVSFNVNAQGVNFRGPAFPNFIVVSGPNGSTSSSIRMINGRTTMSIANSYSYYLQATKEGNYEIQPATISVDNKVYKSNSLTIKVVQNPGSSGQNPGQPNSPQNRNQQQGQTGPQSASNDVYVKAFISNTAPFQGEGIIVTYKIFTKVPISQIAFTKLSSFPGFWSQNLMKENEKNNQSTQTIDGQQYVVADIRKIVLFPLKSGTLTIDPLELQCIAQVKRPTKSRTGDPFFDDFFNDSFFNNSYSTIEKSLKSNPLVVNVKPLPAENKPDGFNGAVGTFSFSSTIDKTKLKTNDAINLKFTVSGEGNIQLIDKLNVTFPPDFETYDPKITSAINPTSSGIAGNQTFEYLVIPRKPGNFTLKPVTFTYFDLKKKQYVSISTPQYAINVEKGSGESAAITYSGVNKEDIKYIGSDIRHIKNQPFTLQRTGVFFFGSTFFYLCLLIPLLLFILLIIFWKKQNARKADIRLMKNRKATKVARNRLRRAEKFLKEQNKEEFYVEISQALWGYLSDKFNIPLADLSMESVNDALTMKNVNEEIIRQFTETLNDTDFARFAPGEKSLFMDKIYNEALEIISKIERELR